MISWALIFPVVHKKWKWSIQWNVFWAKWFPFGNDFLANDFHLEMSFRKWLTSKKTSFLDFLADKNDYYLWEMIYVRFENDFLRKKMISKEHKNDYRGNDFFEMLLKEFKTWFTLEKKKHFERKLLFPEMGGNHFFHGNASQHPQNLYTFHTDKGFVGTWKGGYYVTYGSKYSMESHEDALKHPYNH